MVAFRPEGWPHVIPRIITDDVDGLVAFLRTVFDARGENRGGAPAEMKIGDSVVMVSDGGGQREKWPAFLYVYVDDVDVIHQRAMRLGARSVEEPLDTPYGDRRATFADDWGNMWQIAARFA